MMTVTIPKVGLDDYLATGHSVEDLYACVEDELRPLPSGEGTTFTTISAAELLAKDFIPLRFAVEALIPDGVLLLVGREKRGKSRLNLNLAVAVAAGGKAIGKLDVDPGDVLLLSLEDGERRVQNRLRALLQGRPVPDRLHIATGWRRLDDGGLDDLRAWLAKHPEARLILIDTLKRIRPSEKRSSRLYDLDYDSVAQLTDLAAEYNVSIVVTHHARKMGSDDPLDLVSGSTGLAASVDGVLIFERAPSESTATLKLIHRDAEPLELELKLDTVTENWTMHGDSAEIGLTPERKEIITLLRSIAPSGLGPKKIAVELGKHDRKGQAAVRQLLGKMREQGQIARDSQSRYYIPSPDHNHHSDHNRHSDHSDHSIEPSPENEGSGIDHGQDHIDRNGFFDDYGDSTHQVTIVTGVTASGRGFVVPAYNHDGATQMKDRATGQQFCRTCGGLLPLPKYREAGLCQSCAESEGIEI